MTAKISASADGTYAAVSVGASEAFRFGSDNSGQLAGFRNKLINGAFDVRQRGSSFTLNAQWTSTYCADRWIIALDSASASLVCTFGQDANPTVGWPDNGRYCVLTGTGINPIEPGYLIQRIENVRTLAGQTATLSFSEQLLSGADTGQGPYLQQRFGTGGSETVSIFATSDVKVGYKRTLTFNIPNTLGKTIGTDNYLSVVIPVAGTFSKAFSGLQLEKGSISTPFENRPIGLELSLCQRYYQIKKTTVTTGSAFISSVQLATPMRVVDFPFSVSFDAGTGAGFARYVPSLGDSLYQNTNHSQIATATIACNAEL